MSVSTKDTLRLAKDHNGNIQPDAMLPGTTTGTSAKGYAEHTCDGSEYDKYGNRIDYSQLAAHSFK